MNLPDVDYGIYQKLIASATITTLVGGAVTPRIYNLQAPIQSALPYIVFYHNAGGFDNLTPRGEYTFDYRVECVADSRQVCYTVANACATHLHNNDIPLTGYSNYSTKIGQVYSFIENDNGKQYWRKGFDIKIRYSIE